MTGMGKAINGDVTVGQLWALSWDGVELAAGVVARVFPTFVLVWPATQPDEAWFPPAVELTSRVVEPLAVWPTRETGVGLHLLDACLGQVMSARTAWLLAEALETGEDPPLPFVSSGFSVDPQAHSDRLVEKWEAICFNVWPRPNLGLLRIGELQRLGVTPSHLAEVLDVTIADSVALWNHELALSDLQLDALVAELGVGSEEIVGGESPDFYPGLVAPRRKQSVKEISSRFAIDEGAARDLIKSEFALAARSDGRDEGRLDAAIARLLDAGR